MKKQLFAVALLLLFSSAMAQTPSIIPQPQSVEVMNGKFILSPKTVILVGNDEEENSINFFNHYLNQHYGFRLKQAKKATANFIKLTTPTFVRQPDNEEAYTLQINTRSITIQGDGKAGTFYGIQTLIQLLPTQKNKNNSYAIGNIKIIDAPRFRYRGLHLDCSRHFFSIDYIKKYIDFIALHKLNTFHWHLTDDQGWRLQIKKYPKLTEVGSVRKGTIIGRYPGTGFDSTVYGGFYTQQQAKEIVAYAAARYITVIPEIELPGHSMSALAAYPQLGTEPEKGYTVSTTWGINDKFNNVLTPTDYTFNFYHDVLDEVMQIFPSTYIHIGGDECSKIWWKQSNYVQQFMKDNNIKDEHALQSYFIQRIEKYINSKGRKMMGWDEILEGGLAPNATVMSWRGEKGGIEAAKQKHNVVMTPGGWCYFDHKQTEKEDSVTIGGYTTTQKVYTYEPIPKELNGEEQAYVLGAQANVWTEYMNNTQKVEYMLFPRLSALAEVLWTAKDKKDWSSFEQRLKQQYNRYDLWKINAYKGSLVK